MDEALGRLFGAIKGLGLEKSTDIIIVSDHGMTATRSFCLPLSYFCDERLGLGLGLGVLSG